jgi:hypothetical protein
MKEAPEMPKREERRMGGRDESVNPSPNLWKITANEADRPREGEKRKVEPTAMPSTKL